MNEVKELVEELRNKKSRDNRDLLDRSADMIERLAKELCEKSICHHKCHDTKDCVVEDEAKEVIANSATTTEKQIEEMADDVRRIRESYFGKADYLFAMKLYEDGYRKQSEGEWQIAVDPVEATFICSKCGYFYIEADPQAKTEYKYCPHCGSKMKGGE